METRGCQHCLKLTGYARRKTNDFVCRSCGRTTPLGEVVATKDEHSAEGFVRERVMGLILSREGSIPGSGSLMYKEVAKACRYVGPIDETLYKMQQEGIVVSWLPGGAVYVDSAKARALLGLEPLEVAYAKQKKEDEEKRRVEMAEYNATTDAENAARQAARQADIDPAGDF